MSLTLPGPDALGISTAFGPTVSFAIPQGGNITAAFNQKMTEAGLAARTAVNGVAAFINGLSFVTDGTARISSSTFQWSNGDASECTFGIKATMAADNITIVTKDITSRCPMPVLQVERSESHTVRIGFIKVDKKTRWWRENRAITPDELITLRGYLRSKITAEHVAQLTA